VQDHNEPMHVESHETRHALQKKKSVLHTAGVRFRRITYGIAKVFTD